MSQTPITVTYSLEEVLKEINGKLDKIDTRLINLEIGQTELKTEVQNLKENVKDMKTVQNSLVNEVADLKGVKSLIIPIMVAIVTAFLTLLVRFIPNFPR
jgi:archaellum component FlaC